jgi:hypothetical protein
LTTITVDTALDVVDIDRSAILADLPGPDHRVSLREALLVSDNMPGTDFVVFDTTGAFASPTTIHLTKGQLRIRDSVTIVGTGARNLSIDADGRSRIMLVTDGDATQRLEVTLRDLTLTGGNTTLPGGGIQNLDENLTLERSIISGNHTDGRGGGLYHRGGQLTVLNSTIAHNQARSGGGLWIRTGPTSGISRVINSTLSGNSAGQRGGGLENFSGITHVHNSTITDNEAPLAGGIASKGQSGTITRLGSTIVAGNLSGDVEYVAGSVNSFASSGSNLVGRGNALASFTNNDQRGVLDPGLEPLRDDEGTTPTHALRTGSPAIDTGTNLLGLAADQRGLPFVREVGLGVDVGAYEMQTLSGPFLVDNTDDELDGNFSPGDLSLREAIELANRTPGKDEVRFDLQLFNTPQIIALKMGSLEVTDSMILMGPGAELLTIEGSALWPVFVIDDRVSFPEREIVLAGATVSGGAAGLVSQEHLTLDSMTIHGSAGAGVDVARSLIVRQSEIRNHGSDGLVVRYEFGELEVSSSTIADNQGAGIRGSNYGLVDVQDSRIIRNSGTGITGPRHGGRYAGFVSVSGSTIALNSGGGIDAGNVSIERSTIQGNTGRGGVRSEDGRLAISQSTISGNSSHLGGGGVSFLVSNPFTQNRLTINDSKITDNRSDQDGGGVLAYLAHDRFPPPTYGSVSITASTVTGNRAERHGGGMAIRSRVLAYGGGLTAELNHSTVSGNQAGADGGGIAHLASGGYDESRLTIGNTTIADNRSGLRQTGHGGGIYSSGRLALESSLISGNRTSDGVDGAWGANCNPASYCEYFSYNGENAGDGGGLFAAGPTTSIINSAVVNNATGEGGDGGHGGDGGSGAGIFASGQSLTVRNSTVSGNTTGAGGAATLHRFCHYTYPYSGIFSHCDISYGTDGLDGVGGGIRSLAALDIAFSTLTENSSGVVVAGVASVGSTIISGNAEEDVHQDGGSFLSLGFNLIGRGNAQGSFDQNDLIGILNPGLGPLSDNGGPTPSHKPLTWSPAVDAGDPLPAEPPAFDQRGEGFDRIVGSRIDIGSIELQGISTPIINFEQAVVSSYGSDQDRDGVASTQDEGASLRIVGNAWKKIDLPYEITPNTVLEFDFQSTQQGDIHGIGLDNDNVIGANRTFRLYGTQSFGLGDYDDYDSVAPAKKHYRIPVGQFYEGPVSYLFFVNDHDVRDGAAESVFSRVRLYESTP